MRPEVFPNRYDMFLEHPALNDGIRGRCLDGFDVLKVKRVTRMIPGPWKVSVIDHEGCDKCQPAPCEAPAECP
jgi:hypothetical protein